MRFTFLILVFVLTQAVNEVSSVKEVRDYVKHLIKQVLQPFSPTDNESYQHHPEEDYHGQPIRKDPNGYVKQLHDNLFHSLKKPYVGGHYPGIMEEEVYSTTMAVDEETSPWEVEDQESTSHSESPLKKTLEIPGIPTSPVRDYEKGSTTQLPPSEVAGKNTPAEETHLNPTVEISTDDVLPIIHSLTPETEEGEEKLTPSQKNVGFDIHLSSVSISSPNKDSNNTEEIPTEDEDIQVHEKGDLNKGRDYDDDDDDDNYKIIFRGSYVKTTPAPLEAGYTATYEYD